MARVDLNCDAGEGYGRWQLGDDEAMLQVVTTVNIACGFHAGDPLIMDRTVRLAADRGVAIGAQPGFNDLWGFGRRRITGDTPEQVATMVLYQVGALQAIAARHGSPVTHVKLHGALSNMAAVDAELSTAIGTALYMLDAHISWLVPAGSATAAAARAVGLHTVEEVFADRAYAPDGQLLPRSQPGAVIDDAEVAAQRAVQLVRDGAVIAAGGGTVRLRADSICVHGDTPGAVQMARAVRAALEAAGITVVAWVSPRSGSA